MKGRNWVPEAAAVLFGSVTLLIMMSLGHFLGTSPMETGLALTTMVGAVMIHRLTEAINHRLN